MEMKMTVQQMKLFKSPILAGQRTVGDRLLELQDKVNHFLAKHRGARTHTDVIPIKQVGGTMESLYVVTVFYDAIVADKKTE